jgi:hypothetical protein
MSPDAAWVPAGLQRPVTPRPRVQGQISRTEQSAAAWADVSPLTMLKTKAARRFAVQRWGVSRVFVADMTGGS